MEPSPDPVPRLVHAPGLDGLRGAALAAVVTFHAGPQGWLTGGFLGVSLFFTLSGYLIGSLLLVEVERDGRIDLGRFWVRRARRLIPALLLCVLGTVLLGRFVELGSGARRDLFGGLTYSTNWLQLVAGHTYGDLFGTPSPGEHLWSLAIEEQFYLAFPLVVWALARLRPARTRLAVGLGAAAVAVAGTWSTWATADGDWAYLATPARAPEIALGVLLAATVRPGRPGAPSWGWTAVGLAGSAVTVWAWRAAGLSDGWMARGGLAALAVASVAVVAAAARPGPISRLLSLPPLRALGLVSYGAYLFHWPIVVWLTPQRLGLGPVQTFAVRVAVTLALAAASYHFVERPIRQGWWPQRRAAGGAGTEAASTDADLVRVGPGVVSPARVLSAAAGALVLGLALVAVGVEPDPVTPSRPAGDAPALVPADEILRVDRELARGQPSTPDRQTEPQSPPVVVILGDSVPNWMVRDGAATLDPSQVRLVDGTSEGCDGAEGAPVGRAGTGVVVTVPADCTGWRTQYPATFPATQVDVALLVIGSGAVLDRQLDGAFNGPCDPVARNWYLDDVTARIEYLLEHARRVVLVLPAWAGDNSAWVNPSDHRDRTDCVRTTLQAAATIAGADLGGEDTERLTTLDLADLLCPDGRDACTPYRSTDGVHINPDRAGEVLSWLVDRSLA